MLFIIGLAGLASHRRSQLSSNVRPHKHAHFGIPAINDTSYFAPSTASFMINYRVENLYAVLAALRAEGVQVEEKFEESEYEKFGWVIDPEGNKLELWQPPVGQ